MKQKKRPKRASAAAKAPRKARARAKPLRIVDAVRKPGRPSPYVAEYAHLAAAMCKLGATDLELAQAFGVSHDTLYRWKRLHPEFSEAIQGAKALPDDRVERALYARAIGYTALATKIVQNGAEVIAVEHTEHYPPDTAAAFIWLKNRKPLEWRDRHEIKAEVVDESDPMRLTRAEIQRRLMLLEQRRLDREARAREEGAGAEPDPKK